MTQEAGSAAVTVGAQGQARSAELRAKILHRILQESSQILLLIPRPFVIVKTTDIARGWVSLMHLSHYSNQRTH